MDSHVLRPYFLLALLVGTFVLSYAIFKPFLVPLILAAVFAVVLQPVFKRILRKVKYESVAAGITMLVCIFLIIAPLTFLSIKIVNQARELYFSISAGAGSGYLLQLVEYIDTAILRVNPHAQLPDLYTSINTYSSVLLAWFAGNVGTVFSSIASLAVATFIFIIGLYYFLSDGPKFIQAVKELSPLTSIENELIFSRLELAITSIVRGNLTIALIQGIMTAIGFTLFGVPNSILWGMVASITALIPSVGTSLVVLPGAAFMFISGHHIAGFGLLLWSFFAVGSIDNLLGPRLVGRGMQIHSLIVMLSVLGGLSFFGPAGILLGPLCISLLFAVVSIHSKEIRKDIL